MGDMFKNAAVTDLIGGCPKCGEISSSLTFSMKGRPERVNQREQDEPPPDHNKAGICLVYHC